MLCGFSPDFSGLSPCYRQIAYMLLTRAPVASKGIATSLLPLDLHVLGLSLAFILSQDQTLRCISCFFLFLYLRISPAEIDFALSLVLLFFPVFSMNLALRVPTAPEGPPVRRKCCKVTPFPPFPPNFLPSFFEKIFNAQLNSLNSCRLYLNFFVINFVFRHYSYQINSFPSLNRYLILTISLV